MQETLFVRDSAIMTDRYIEMDCQRLLEVEPMKRRFRAHPAATGVVGDYAHPVPTHETTGEKLYNHLAYTLKTDSTGDKALAALKKRGKLVAFR